MTDTLIQNARLVLTMDPVHSSLQYGDVLLRGGFIVAVGVGLPSQGCPVVNARAV